MRDARARYADQKIITGVAVTYRGEVYSMPPPARHRQVLDIIYEKHGPTLAEFPEQGFLTADGFVNRRQAAALMDKEHGDLFSEDLW